MAEVFCNLKLQNILSDYKIPLKDAVGIVICNNDVCNFKSAAGLTPVSLC